MPFAYRIGIFLFDLDAEFVGTPMFDKFVVAARRTRCDQGDERPADDAADQARYAKPVDEEGDEQGHAGTMPSAAARCLAFLFA